MGKYIFPVMFVVGMTLMVLFAGRIGYWIEQKVQSWQLRRKQAKKNNP